MQIALKKKYRCPQYDAGHKDVVVRGGRGGQHSSNRSGTKRSKGLNHPVGFSGRQTGRMIRAFRGTKK